jgi:hypothetical protein
VRADAYFGLLHGLEDLFARKIDLVTIQAIRNPWFRRAVDWQKGKQYRFVLSACRSYWCSSSECPVGRFSKLAGRFEKPAHKTLASISRMNPPRAHPVRLSPFLREAGGGRGMKEMHRIFFLFHFTNPSPAGVSPSWPFFLGLRKQLKKSLTGSRSTMSSLAKAIESDALELPADFFSGLLRRREHVSKVESGEAEVSLPQGLVAGNPLGSR